MSKYNKGEAGPLELFLYDKIAPVLGTFMYEKMGMTPNAITTLSLALGLLTIYQFTKSNYKLVALLLVIRQIFDGVDGYVARKYKLSSKNGAYYDVLVDRLSVYPLLAMILLKLYKKVPSASFLSILFTIILYGKYQSKRHQCIAKEDECVNPTIRSSVLKYTVFFSALENTILLAILIYNIK